MKMIIALAALVAVAMAAPQTRDADIRIVNEAPLEIKSNGDYKYAYEQSNGATKEESAHLVPGDGPEEEPSYEVAGRYTYTDPATGLVYEVRYTAGKEGFNAEAGHIPK